MVNEFRFGFTNSLIDTTFPIQGASADNQLGLTGISFANHPTYRSVPDLQFLRRYRLYADRPRQGRAGRVQDHAVHRQSQPHHGQAHPPRRYRRPQSVLRDRGAMGPIGRFRRVYVQPGRLHGQFIRRFPAGRAQHGFHRRKQSQYERAERSMGGLRAGSMAGKRPAHRELRACDGRCFRNSPKTRAISPTSTRATAISWFPTFS